MLRRCQVLVSQRSMSFLSTGSHWRQIVETAFRIPRRLMPVSLKARPSSSLFLPFFPSDFTYTVRMLENPMLIPGHFPPIAPSQPLPPSCAHLHRRLSLLSVSTLSVVVVVVVVAVASCRRVPYFAQPSSSPCITLKPIFHFSLLHTHILPLLPACSARQHTVVVAVVAVPFLSSRVFDAFHLTHVILPSHYHLISLHHMRHTPHLSPPRLRTSTFITPYSYYTL